MRFYGSAKAWLRWHDAARGEPTTSSCPMYAVIGEVWCYINRQLGGGQLENLRRGELRATYLCGRAV
jgi:hypothetical protein